MSIIEESRKSRQNGVFGFLLNKKIIIPLILMVIIGLGFYYYFDNKEEAAGRSVAAKDWTVKKTDIIIATEADGKVVAEDGVELSFGSSDDNLEVREVFVKEGDTVKKGDKIASIETDALELSLSSAWSSYQSALAAYNETMEGATKEEIADTKDKIESAEISLSQQKISLENTKQSIEDNLYQAKQALKDANEDLEENQDELTSEDVKDAYEDLVDTVKADNIALETNLADSDEIIGIDKEYLNDGFEKNLGAKDLATITEAKRSYTIARNELKDLNEMALALNINSDYDDIDTAAAKAASTLEAFEKHFYDMKLLLDNTITNSSLSQSELNSFVSTVTSARSSINTKITGLNTKIKTVDSAKESLKDYIEAYEEAERDLANAEAEAERDLANAEASLRAKEMSLEQAKRDYDELTAPLTESEIASARSKLTSASVSLAKAQNELDATTIISPIDGQVVELNYKAGDIIVDNDEPVAMILNSETLFIEVNIEEADVSALAVGQEAIAVFDALDETQLKGEISFISLTSETSNNGIVTYKVRVVIENPEKKKIREGMTAYIDFIKGGVKGVLAAPVSAVRNVGGQPSVQLLSGQWTPVTTGFTDGKYVEIISGVSEGDKILY